VAANLPGRFGQRPCARLLRVPIRQPASEVDALLSPTGTLPGPRVWGENHGFRLVLAEHNAALAVGTAVAFDCHGKRVAPVGQIASIAPVTGEQPPNFLNAHPQAKLCNPPILARANRVRAPGQER
jgi:hypothetical protein